MLFARDGVLPACIHDNAKEMIHGKIHQKLKEAACYLKQLEQYTPWSKAAEREIKELEVLHFCSSDHQSAYGSNTAHDIYKLDGEVSETVMLSETSDISQFCLDWFE